MNTRVFACAVIKDQDGKFLILKRADNSNFAPGQWEFVSGFMEEGEAAEETIVRETQEETGQKGEIVKTLPSYELNDEDGRWVVIPYLCRLPDNDVIISDGHSDFKWVTFDELSTIKELSQDVDQLEKGIV